MAEAKTFDLFVIGGGVNGCGIARDAAGRGFSVGLAEMNDLASGTSSAATKLIHGGLRYLEHYEFRLVRESLEEREVLWAMAPHIIWPLRFVLPHHKALRPAMVLRAGLFIYDHIGGRKRLPAARTVGLKRHPAGAPLKPVFDTGFEYSDCWVDDSRLVALNARDAANRGADIRTRTEVVAAKQDGSAWTITLREKGSAATELVRARMLINAAGPWVDRVLGAVHSPGQKRNVRLVKGSHIVVNRLFDHGLCYIFQNADNRIIFAIPYEMDFTLIGTTDLDYTGDPAEASISSEEISYLLDAASEYFRNPVTRDKVAWAYSGVRPLYDDGASKAQEATRDYVLKLESDGGQPALLNVFGGKLTTYRRLAESVMERVEQVLGAKGARWTAGSHLPGGNFSVDAFEAELDKLLAHYPFLHRVHARRLLHLYGTDAHTLLGQAKSIADLGEQFGWDLTQREVDYLVQNEWARDAEDILWRRTKLGLRLNERESKVLEAYLQSKRGERAA